MNEYTDDIWEVIDMYADPYTDEELYKMFKESEYMVGSSIDFDNLCDEDTYFEYDDYYPMLEHYKNY